MIPVVGVRFKKAGKVYYFDPGECTVDVGTRVIVETAQGVECGEIAIGTKLVPHEDVIQPIRRIMRVADDDDLDQITASRQNEKEALLVGIERVKKLGLDMKIVDSEWTFDHQKLVFYFISDDRVDFRELVKELAAHFRTRIELRQIGVRDQSKMLGGYGVCGRALCCATWIGDFEPISIRHAKEQDLSLNPSKISGVCGRLKCCLRFEADVYQEIRKRMPKVGTYVATPQGLGKIIEIHVIKERVTVLIDTGDEFRRIEVGLDELENSAPTPAFAMAEHAVASVDSPDLAKETYGDMSEPPSSDRTEAEPSGQKTPKAKKNKRRPRRSPKPHGSQAHGVEYE